VFDAQMGFEMSDNRKPDLDNFKYGLSKFQDLPSIWLTPCGLSSGGRIT
jgi:hypothetical protein